MVTRLARRDRAALALAYECLKRRAAWVGDRPGFQRKAALCVSSAIGALAYCDDTTAYDASERCLHDTPSRLLRVRLALLLRALLRADAHEGEVRSFRVMEPSGRVSRLMTYADADAVKDEGDVVVRMSPLWEQAGTR